MVRPISRVIKVDDGFEGYIESIQNDCFAWIKPSEIIRLNKKKAYHDAIQLKEDYLGAIRGLTIKPISTDCYEEVLSIIEQ